MLSLSEWFAELIAEVPAVMVVGIQGFGLFGEWVGLKHVVQSGLQPSVLQLCLLCTRVTGGHRHTWPREPLFLKECVDSLVKKNQVSRVPLGNMRNVPWKEERQL